MVGVRQGGGSRRREVRREFIHFLLARKRETNKEKATRD